MLQAISNLNSIPKELLAPASIIFFIIYALIIFRNLRIASLPVWVIMFAGAVSILLLNCISLKEAYAAINLDVIFFLLGMFSLVSALEVSGLLRYITLRILTFANSPEKVLLLILVGLGTLSAFLMNDTIALVATPIVIDLAREMSVNPTPFLIALAFAVSIGSAMTPMGNPQNLLIALASGMESPLFSFLLYLAPPTIINYFATYLILKFYYRNELSRAVKPPNPALEGAITDLRLAKLAGCATILTMLGFFSLSLLNVLGYRTDLNFGTVALLGAAVVFALSPRSRDIMRNVNWSIIVFFISMFIVMRAVWNTGLIKLFASSLPQPNHGGSPMDIVSIVVVSTLLSQLMSNVPFVAIYVNLMKDLGFGPSDTKAWAALAGASTLAGNLTILGAASTIIILEASEERGYTFSFFEYFKIGSIVTLVCTGILTLWLILV